MENVQRSVMLLRPDTHAPGRWEGGATLRLQGAPGGVSLSLKTDDRFGTGGTLLLLLKDGTLRSAGEVPGDTLNAVLYDTRPADVAAAALVCGGRFALKSSFAGWPDVIARYRFAQAAKAPASTSALVAATANPTKSAEFEPASARAPAEKRPGDAPAEQAPVSESVPIEQAPASTPPEPATNDACNAEEAAPIPAPRPENPSCSAGIRQNNIEPFPSAYPGSEWIKISYPGPTGWWHYIFGRVRIGGREADAIGVPGEYSMTPPAWLDGFTTWVRCTSGDARGYWLMFQDAQTGRHLDAGQSRRDG